MSIDMTGNGEKEMNKERITLLISLVLLMTVLTSIGTSAVETNDHMVNINTENKKISVEEKIEIKGSSNNTYKNVSFWIMDDAEGVKALFNNNPSSNLTVEENVYTYEISDLNITKKTKLEVTLKYTLNKDIATFKKKLIRNTSKISVTFDEQKIYTAENLKAESFFSQTLYHPSETPLSWYIIVFIILLVVLLAVSTLYSFKKQKSSKRKRVEGSSEEFLTTKKNLLMSLLKEVEKKHRSGDISDDTYHKLKDNYKQQAVDAMKKLEDLQSELE